MKTNNPNMKKISVREVETLKTTHALYAHGCGMV